MSTELYDDEEYIRFKKMREEANEAITKKTKVENYLDTSGVETPLVDNINTFSDFEHMSEEDLLEYLQEQEQEVSKYILNIDKYFTKFFTDSKHLFQLLELKKDYIEIFRLSESKKFKDIKAVDRDFCTIVLDNFKDKIYPKKVQSYLNNIDKYNDIKFIFMDKIVLALREYLKNNHGKDISVSGRTIEKFKYDDKTVITAFKNDTDNIRFFKDNLHIDSEKRLENLLILKQDKIKQLQNTLKKYTQTSNDGEKLDLKYQLAENILELTDNLKCLITVDEIREIYHKHITKKETELIFNIYTSQFLIDKSKEFISEIDTKEENYISPLNKDKGWLKISKKQQSVLINFLENIKRRGLSEFLPMLNSIIELNYNDETFIKDLEDIQLKLQDKDNENLFKQYIYELLKDNTKRFRIINDEISEIKNSHRFRILNNDEIDFIAAGAGEIDGAAFNKDKSICILNFCTTRKNTGSQNQIYKHYPKLKEKLEKEGVSKIIPYVYNNALIPDNYRKSNKKNWYKNENIKIKESEKRAINILTSFNFMFHSITKLTDTSDIFKSVKCQLFDSDDMTEFSNKDKNERIYSIYDDTFRIAEFLKTNKKHLDEISDRDKKDIFSGFFNACIYMANEIIDITEKDKYKNNIKEIMTDILSDLDIDNLMTKYFDTDSSHLVNSFLVKFNLIDIKIKKDDEKNIQDFANRCHYAKR